MENVVIPKSAVICAATHFIELHESVKAKRLANWAAPCVACPIFSTCQGDWNKTAAPLFETVGLHPMVIELDQPGGGATHDRPGEDTRETGGGKT